MHLTDLQVILVSETDASLRIVLAALLGAMLGLERSIAGKHAGMRTYGMVSVGACLFTTVGIIAAQQFSMFATINPLQLASSVIIGIGFVGAGLSMFHDTHPVELTTAAGILVAAGVGIAAGFGLVELSVVAVLMSLLLLRVFTRIEHSAQKRFGDGVDEKK